MSWIERFFMFKFIGFWVILGIVVLASIMWIIYIAIEEHKAHRKEKKQRRKKDEVTKDV